MKLIESLLYGAAEAYRLADNSGKECKVLCTVHAFLCAADINLMWAGLVSNGRTVRGVNKLFLRAISLNIPYTRYVTFNVD
jgi:hypothetical protein